MMDDWGSQNKLFSRVHLALPQQDCCWLPQQENGEQQESKCRGCFVWSPAFELDCLRHVTVCEMSQPPANRKMTLNHLRPGSKPRPPDTISHPGSLLEVSLQKMMGTAAAPSDWQGTTRVRSEPRTAGKRLWKPKNQQNTEPRSDHLPTGSGWKSKAPWASQL